MNIYQYLKTTHPWFDTANYEPWQIAVFTIGALLWIVAYVIILQAAFRDKKLIIPVAAVVCNFGNEVSGAFFFVPDMGLALVVAYWLWMLLDMVIIYNMFRYGKDQWSNPYLRANFGWLTTISIICSIGVSSTFMVRYDLPMGVLDAYIVNVVMSVSFIGLLFSQGLTRHSALLGWTKFLGTGIISVMFATKYPDNFFLITLYITVAFFDVLYLALTAREKRLQKS